jgi:predicted nucleic acid-binding protein
MKVLLDVNVVLDVLLQRHDWLAQAQAIWDAAESGRWNAASVRRH